MSSFSLEELIRTDPTAQSFWPSSSPCLAISANKTSPLTIDGARYLAKCLAADETFRHIIMDVVLTDEALAAFAEFLKTNKSVVILDMNHCRNIWDTGMVAFADALKQNETLEQLGINYATVSDDGIRALADTIANRLINIEFIHAKISSEGVNAILRACQKVGLPARWRAARFTNIRLNDECANTIADMFRHNASVEYLSISDTDIGDDGLIAISEMLKSNCAIETLNLDGTKIGKRGIAALIEALSCNSTLLEVSLHRIDFDDDTMALLEGLGDQFDSKWQKKIIRKHTAAIKGARKAG